MEKLYKKYSRLVYNYLYTLTSNIELSEELMQETFFDAMKCVNSFNGNSKISVWLCQIAKNKWKDYLTKSNKMKLISLENNGEEITIEDNILEQLTDKEDIKQLYKAIQKLDESTRDVFYLRIKGELTFKEIAEIIGKSEEWARVTFYRGKLKIKEMILKNEK